jgi:two-component system cell cycle response regulator
VALCALSVLHRALRGARPRRPWLLLGIGMTGWAVGELLFDFVLGSDPPLPSIADAGYLLLYPAAYAALVALVRPRLGLRSGALLLDGVVAGLAVASLAFALVVSAVERHLGGGALADATALAYPLADTLLLALVLAMLGLTGWRPGRALLLVMGGFALLGGADAVYAYASATDTYQPGLLDVGWALGMLALAAGAWQVPPPAPRAIALDGWRVLAIPSVFGVLALGVLVLDHFHPVDVLAVVLAAAALVATIGRLWLTFAEKATLLALARSEAVTDPLTGLGNRRQLASDLSEALASGRPHLLLLFDLDGFKAYNDSFGHPAGDALLTRLGRALQDASAPDGDAYRMGGDEFCALLSWEGAHDGEQLVDRTTRALTARGEAFEVSTSWGGVLVPEEAQTDRLALGLADRRMYAHKHARRPSPGRQSTDVLLRVLEERYPDLGKHGRTVAALAGNVAARLGLDPDAAEAVSFAAELHDVGKVAIPDAILHKPTALDADEWEFMHRHTLIAERIVAAAPALSEVAAVVRSSHERLGRQRLPRRPRRRGHPPRLTHRRGLRRVGGHDRRTPLPRRPLGGRHPRGAAPRRRTAVGPEDRRGVPRR